MHVNNLIPTSAFSLPVRMGVGKAVFEVKGLSEGTERGKEAQLWVCVTLVMLLASYESTEKFPVTVSDGE